MPRELIGLDALGVCAVKGTLSAVAGLQQRSEDLKRQAARLLQQAKREREDLLAALSMELGVQFPEECRFRLQGSTLEVVWAGDPASLAAGVPEELQDEDDEAAGQAVEVEENVDQAEPEEAKAVEEPATVGS